jgi:uncharacterized membrane protein YdjX (TVP38/TMEM64 family)
MDRDAKARLARPIWIAVVSVAAGVFIVGVVAPMDLRHLGTESLADRVRDLGMLGPLAIVALLVAQAVVAPIPSPPILAAAGYVFGPWVGFAIGWLGLLLGASACFGLARAFGRPFARRFVRSEQLASVDDFVSTRTGSMLLTLVSLRVFMPPLFDAVSYGCGLVRVPFGWFLVATGLGEVPKVGSFTYIGAAADGVSSWLTAWLLLGPAIGLLIFRIVRARAATTDTTP